uniref:DNA-directed RNA polymerase n=1 Tax=Uronema sp. FACHB-2429 TaxID=2725787 RepID=A0A6H1U5U1_9CHLO|nr:beta subunit of RNA polymerase [Uronema sp. FACHB-2429]
MAIEKYFIPDFVELQRQSFFNFLEKGLIEELNKRNPITNNQRDLEILFYPEYYKLCPPRWNSFDAILLSKTYACRLYVPVQLTNRKKKQIIFKWIHLGDIPLMSKRGHFVVNGAARVIINQIVRGPGLYFSEIQYNIESQKKTLVRRYAAEFISMRGTWLRFSIDKEKMIWAELKKTPKIPLIWFLLGMGLTEKILFQSLTQPKRLLSSYLDYLEIDNCLIEPQSQNDAFAKRSFFRQLIKKSKAYDSQKTLIGEKKKKNSHIRQPVLLHDIYKDNQMSKEKENRRSADEKDKIPQYANSSLKALQLIYAKITNTKKITTMNKNFFVKQGQKWIFKKFMNPRTYDLGLHGRLSLNKKLSLSLPLSQRTLTMYDVLVATEYLLRVEQGLLPTDDIDNLKNRRVRTSSDLIQMQIGIGLLRLEKNIRSKFLTSKFIPKLQYFFSTKPLNGALKEFFGTNPLSQFMDMINPLAEMTHKRRLTSLGPGGVSRDTATMDIRGIHPTHYGRICPVETPEGKNAGLVNALTTFARVNPEGLIETPFYKVYQGQVQKNAGFFYFTADYEDKAIIAAGDIHLSKTGFLPRGLIPARKFDEFNKVVRNSVDFMSVSPLQMVSIATSLVPFLEHDDANRALMGANMQRQAVPLIRPEQAIVGTGTEARIPSDSGHVIRTKVGGLVSYVSSQKIKIYTFIS